MLTTWEAVPEAPAVPTVLFPEARARRRRRRRRNLLVLVVVLLLVGIVVGLAWRWPGRPSPPAAGHAATSVTVAGGPATDVAIGTYIHQPGEPPKLCGLVLASLPPQCGLPVILSGVVDEQIPQVRAYNGVAYTEGAITVYGTYHSGVLSVVRVVVAPTS